MSPFMKNSESPVHSKPGDSVFILSSSVCCKYLMYIASLE